MALLGALEQRVPRVPEYREDLGDEDPGRWVAGVRGGQLAPRASEKPEPPPHLRLPLGSGCGLHLAFPGLAAFPLRGLDGGLGGNQTLLGNSHQLPPS